MALAVTVHLSLPILPSILIHCCLDLQLHTNIHNGWILLQAFQLRPWCLWYHWPPQASSSSASVNGWLPASSATWWDPPQTGFRIIRCLRLHHTLLLFDHEALSQAIRASHNTLILLLIGTLWTCNTGIFSDNIRRRQRKNASHDSTLGSLVWSGTCFFFLPWDFHQKLAFYIDGLFTCGDSLPPFSHLFFFFSPSAPLARATTRTGMNFR